LTNADERAWYDSHRDQILKGKDVGDSQANESDTSYITKGKLAKYFATSAFQGYSKPPSDFYTVFNKLFKTLDYEEEQEEEVGTKHKEAPMFGDSMASKDEVFAFYKYWENFTTIK